MWKFVTCISRARFFFMCDSSNHQDFFSKTKTFPTNCYSFKEFKKKHFNDCLGKGDGMQDYFFGSVSGFWLPKSCGISESWPNFETLKRVEQRRELWRCKVSIILEAERSFLKLIPKLVYCMNVTVTHLLFRFCFGYSLL